MKTLLLVLLVLFFATTTNATNYYFSAISGDDTRTAAQAQDAATPWKTLTKFNSFFSTLQPGDSVLFKRGETFYGSLTVNKSGTVTLPIVIGAYGTGNKPVITGLQPLTDWVSIGNGKYECASATLGTQVNIVTVNDVEHEMGRYPNSNAANGGYLNFKSHVNNTSITDSNMISPVVWTGAELVVRTNRYIIDRTQITGQSGSTISYSPALTYVPMDGFGYFIQNDIRTLDQVGEWYYNAAAKKMDVFFGTNSPAAYSIKASGIANVVYIYDFDNIVMDNLNITGGNSYSVYLYSATNINIKNCDVSSSGIDGIIANNTTNLTIENSTVLNSNNIGVNLSNSKNGAVRNNIVKNSGILPGMGQNNGNKSVGIRETGKNNLIEYNEIDSTGYMGIRFGGDYAVIKNNLVNGFNLTKDDGGGIYTSNTVVGRKVIGNIVLNGIGAASGTTNLVASSTSGIYMDDETNSVELTGNTVANCNKSGIFLHNAHEITMQQNTIFNNAGQQLLMSHNLSTPNSSPIRNNILKNNILFAKNADQAVLNLMTVNNDVSLTAGTMDSNYYCRPLDDNFVIKTSAINAAGTSIYQNCDLQNWQSYYNKDLATKKTAVRILTHRVNGFIGDNKFTNGEFNTTVTGISVTSTCSSLSKNWISNGIDSGTLQMVTSSTNPGITTATIRIGAITTAKKYVIGFSVKNSKDTVMYVYARQSAAPYKVLSNSGIVTVLTMTPARQDFELEFTPTADEANTVIFFETPSQNNTWLLDNIKIYEADISETNVDDSVRFEYNASQSAKTVALAGAYTDPRGVVYNNSIVLQPYTSAILIKQYNSAIVAPSNIAPTVSVTTPVTNATFTSSADIMINATANDTDGLVSRVEFYNGNTLLGSDSTSPYTFTWANVAPGTYAITAKATDNGSLVTTSSAVTISVNPNVAPTIGITIPVIDGGFISPAPITINATATDTDGSVSKVEFYNGNTLLGTSSTSPYTFTWTNVEAGTYVITAKATDNGSLVTTSSAVSILVINPNVAPTVNIITPVSSAIFVTPADITINATAADVDGSVSKVEFYNGNTLLGSSNTSPYAFTWTNVAPGTYVIRAKVTDNGSLVTTSSAVTISVNPNVAPAISITIPVNDGGFISPAPITINATATDVDGSVSKVEFYNGNTLLGTSSTSPYTFTWNNVAAGTYSITAKATDNGSLVTTSSPVNVSVVNPNVAPTVNITTPVSNAVFVTPADITITATATDTDGLVSRVEFYNGSTLLGSDTTSPYTFTWANVAPGTYVITAKATDNGSLVTTSSAVTILVNPNVAPTIGITIPVNDGGFISPAPITINATATDTDGSVSKVEFYNGSTLLGTSSTSPYTFIWTNVAAGTYSITAKATDNGSLVTTSSAVSVSVVNPNVAPTVNITTPLSNTVFVAPAGITITASANDADGSVTKVEFYNGSTLLGTSSTSPYTFIWNNVAPGTYVITAKATDNRSMVTTSSAVNLTVNPNVAPTVNITIPVPGGGFKASGTITITATASDVDGSVSKVEFYNGNTLLGSDNTSPYAFAWKNVAAGNYIITAVATDNKGSLTATSGISVSVVENIAPVVTITSPIVNAGYTSAALINMSAVASDADGTITKVDFFNGTTLLTTERFAPYTYSWKDVPVGNYTITAVATDNNGLTTATSVSVSVIQNIAPTVKITGSSVKSGYTASINMSGQARDTDGTISKVEFYNGKTLLTTERIFPYTYTWKNLAAGNYMITAIATDNNGLTASDSVLVLVTVNAAPILMSGNLTNKISSNTGSSVEALSLKVGPDPASNVLSIFTHGIQVNKELKITVLSMSGAVINAITAKASYNAVRLNIASLNSGVYTVRVTAGNDVLTKQFIKL